MDLMEVLTSRYSVRAYRPDPVEPEKLAAVLEAARLAPTACNRQPFQILVIRTEGRREELARIYHRPWFADAPLVIGFCSLPQSGWRRRDGKSYADVDAAIDILKANGVIVDPDYWRERIQTDRPVPAQWIIDFSSKLLKILKVR